MYHGKTQLIAKTISDQADYSTYCPKTINYNELPLPHGWMNWAIYTSTEESSRTKQLKEDINTYNQAVELINCLPGFLEDFKDHKLIFKRSTIEEKWGNDVANQLFSIGPFIFTTEFYHSGDLLKGVLTKAVPEYEVEFPQYGIVRFKISGFNDIEYNYYKNSNKHFGWNTADDERDFAADIWCGDWRLNDWGLREFFDGEEAEEQDLPGFGPYDCWEQGRYDIDEEGVDRRLLKSIDLLETCGYLKTYSIRPDDPHPCWNNMDKTDSTVDAMVLDLSYKKDTLLCEKIKLILYSKDIYNGVPASFSTGIDGKLYLMRTSEMLDTSFSDG